MALVARRAQQRAKKIQLKQAEEDAGFWCVRQVLEVCIILDWLKGFFLQRESYSGSYFK